MRKLNSIFFSLIIAAVLLVIIKPASATNPPSQSVFVQEYLGQNSFIEGRLSDLLGAMSQDQMNWAPAEGVRTCGQIYLHVAEANHMLTSFMTGAEMEGERGAMEKSTTDKDEIANMLNITEGTSKSQLFKARNMLQQKINELNKTSYGTK